MEIRVNSNRTYYTRWESNDLDGSDEAKLVIEPVRVYAKCDRVVFTVRSVIDHHLQDLPHDLPDGLYCYYLTSTDGSKQYSQPEEVLLGSKKKLSVWEGKPACNMKGFRRFVISSPQPLREGDCSLEYPCIGQVPLPATKYAEEGNTLSFLLRSDWVGKVTLHLANGLDKILELPPRL